MARKVDEKLCKKCLFRTRKGAWFSYKCDYEGIVGEVRLDKAGTCSKFKEKENGPGKRRKQR